MDAAATTKELLEWSIPVLDSVPVLRAILGVALVFFAPGFTWSLFIRNINRLERLVVSFGLSIAIVTLSILFLNLVFKMPITGPNATITLVVLTVIPLGIRYGNRYFRRKSPPSETSAGLSSTSEDEDAG